jgi:hypothetical protein
MASEIHVFDTFLEGGSLGPKRLFVYHNGRQVNSHTVQTDWDVNRIKDNYESSFHEPIRICKSD